MPDEIAEYLGPISDEFASLDLGDKRRNARAVGIAERLAEAPARSFPKLVRSEAEREALYRLLNNDAVEFREIVWPHALASAQRGASQGLTRVVHDTTDFVFKGDREGMGLVMHKMKGFFGHFALAVSGGEARVPLGVVGIHPFARSSKPPKESLTLRKRQGRATPRAEKEAHRWETLAVETQTLFANGDAIHVMDQEADDYYLFAALEQAGLRYVIRGSSERRLQPRRGRKIQEVLDEQRCESFRTVPLTARPKNRAEKHRKAHPPREERKARLEIRWVHVDVERPEHSQSDVPSLSLWAVQVFEPEPPPGESAIQWTLYTNEPVEDAAAATAVVDHYRARWRIEEYFRALKQGCAVEKRQLCSYDAMVRAIALLAPVAWRLLLLRSLGRDDTPLPAAAIFDEDELAAARILCEHARCYKLPPEPTIREFMFAVAALGGHIRNNGEPGWLVLGRGFDDLLQATVVVRATRSRAREI